MPESSIQHRMAFESYIPAPDEEIVVQTDDLCRLSGGCDKCPGHVLAKDVGLMELNPLETVWCTHGCHRTQ